MDRFTNYGATRFAEQANTNQNQTEGFTLTEKFVGTEIAYQTLNGAEDLLMVNLYENDVVGIPNGINEINEAIAQGLDINSMMGIGFENKAFADKILGIRDDMTMLMYEMGNDHFGGSHWSELVESIGWAEYLGIAHEAYECTDEGVNNAYNHREMQIYEQTDGEVEVDINGDGNVGNATTSDEGDCDGETGFLGKVWEWAKDVADDLLNDDDDDDEKDEEGSKTDADDCFPKPWDHEQYNMLDNEFEMYGQDSSEFSTTILIQVEFSTTIMLDNIQDNSIFLAADNFF